MRYGINNWVYAGEPLEVTFARLAKYGYNAIELKGEVGEYSVDEVCRLAEKYGVQVSSVLGWCLWGIPGRDLSSPDPQERQAAVRYGQEVVDFAAAVGAPIMIVLPFPANRTAPVGNPTGVDAWFEAARQEWANAVDSVKQAAAYAAARGITLVVEPINRYETYQLTTVDDAIRFVNEVGADNVKLNLDTYHMNIDEPDLPGAIRKAGALLAHMHGADSNRQAPGRGHTDFRPVVKALNEIGFKGTFVLEAVPPGANPGISTIMPENLPLRDIYAEESIRFLKQVEREVAQG